MSRFVISFATLIVLALLSGVVGAMLGLSRPESIVIGGLGAILWTIYELKYSKKAVVRRKSKTARKYESPYVVTFDGTEVVVIFKKKRRESVKWDDLKFVGITIEDAFLPFPYWILGGPPGGCVYPNDAVGGAAILTELQKRLPGFDNLAVVRAMGMMSGGVAVWERNDKKPAAPANTF